MKTTHASDFHHNPLFQTSKELKKEKHFIGIHGKQSTRLNVRVIGDAVPCHLHLRSAQCLWLVSQSCVLIGCGSSHPAAVTASLRPQKPVMFLLVYQCLQHKPTIYIFECNIFLRQQKGHFYGENKLNNKYCHSINWLIVWQLIS